MKFIKRRKQIINNLCDSKGSRLPGNDQCGRARTPSRIKRACKCISAAALGAATSGAVAARPVALVAFACAALVLYWAAAPVVR